MPLLLRAAPPLHRLLRRPIAIAAVLFIGFAADIGMSVGDEMKPRAVAIFVLGLTRAVFWCVQLRSDGHGVRRLGKSDDASFSSINALAESCVKFYEACASASHGDDLGMNLQAKLQHPLMPVPANFTQHGKGKKSFYLALRRTKVADEFFRS